VARRIPQAHEFVLNQNFKGLKPDLFLGQELSGKTLGIIGHGRIGKKVGEYAKAFGLQVIHTGNRSLEEVLRQSDVITIHVPLNTNTHHLIKMKEFKMMKSNCIFINTSRGPVVCEEDLAGALSLKLILGGRPRCLRK